MPIHHSNRLRPMARLQAILLLLVAALLGVVTPTQSQAAQEVFASLFFDPEPAEDPTLGGILKVDLFTGAYSTFIAPGTAGLFFATDVAVGPHDNALYVSTQLGTVLYFDSVTGAPLPSKVSGQPDGTFALLPTAEFGDGALSLLFDDDGTLNVATAFGSITLFDGTTGAQLADLASGLSPISGLDHAPDGALLASSGFLAGGPGEIYRVSGGTATPLVLSSPGVSDAANPTVVYTQSDANSDGVTDILDLDILSGNFGDFATDSTEGDFNGDNTVDILDLDILSSEFGAEARIIVADIYGNHLSSFALDGSDGQTLAIVPPNIPVPLPPNANFPTNSPSEVLVDDNGNLILSTLGLTFRPDNRAALLEFDRDGNFIRPIAADLPPISGIAFVPLPVIGEPIPEPATAVLALIALGLFPKGRLGR